MLFLAVDVATIAYSLILDSSQDGVPDCSISIPMSSEVTLDKSLHQLVDTIP